MTILAGDIKLVASQVMNDVPEGGGQPTSTVIADGASNAIFPDISELDRAGGRVNLRKVFATVQTPTTDSYMGANLIVAEPPADPNVSVTLFATGDTFDTRDDAVSRVESYLSIGAADPALLFGDHLAGQMTLQLIQMPDDVLPVTGQTLCLVKLAGTASQYTQYVRITSVASTTRTFTDDAGNFDRVVITANISDQLGADFPGFPALRNNSSILYTGKTQVFDTIVADAARYYGVVPLTKAASTGDFTIQADGIFTQLVPSAQIETPIADSRPNQRLYTLVPAGQSLTISANVVFDSQSSLYIGAGIIPGSLSIARSGITLIDKGGLLVNSTDLTQVGTVDYANGVMNLSTDIFGTVGGTHTIVYTPAGGATVVNQSLGIKVTSASQRLTYAMTLIPTPAKASLQVAYLYAGHWYVLTEDGSGAIRGSDSSFGVGTLNYSTGSVVLTLGALPDVGSQVILLWAVEASAPEASSLGGLNKALVEFTLPSSFVPGSLTATWVDHGGTSRTVTDDGAGGLTGYGGGHLEYSTGLVQIYPTALPAVGASFHLAYTPQTVSGSNNTIAAFTDGGTTWTCTVAHPLGQKTFKATINATWPTKVFPGVDQNLNNLVTLTDDGSGNLQVVQPGYATTTVGTIDYTTGAVSINKSVANFPTMQNIYTTVAAANGSPSYTVCSGQGARNVTATFTDASSLQAQSLLYSYSSTSGAATSVDMLATYLKVYTQLQAGYSLAPGAKFTLGGQTYTSQPSGDLSVIISGAPVVSTAPGGGFTTTSQTESWGSVVYQTGVFTLTSWAYDQPCTLSNFSAAQTPPTTGITTPLAADVAVFRTALAPLKPSSFSISGTWTTGEAFTATADASGVISTGALNSRGVFGTVDYNTGVIELRFGHLVDASTPSSTPGYMDLSYLGISGVTTAVADGVLADSLRYNASAYTYLPIDANVLGIDPVRLPSDGRVPIFRAGSFAVVANSKTSAPQTVTVGQVYNAGRVRLSRVRIVGNDGNVINTGYTTDLEAGTVTFTDVSTYPQPVTIEDRIEDMALISDAQISGQLSFTRALTHDYPLSGSYVSSALVVGDMQARVSLTFDQQTWTNVFSDDVTGSPAVGTFNSALSPIQVTNEGALTERWAVQFTNTTTFQVIGEHVGVIATGNISADCAPVNPATGAPYFTIPAVGWGGGWATGNVLRFNTVGAIYPVWVVRTIQQGPDTVNSDSFTLLVRGDVDAP